MRKRLNDLSTSTRLSPWLAGLLAIGLTSAVYGQEQQEHAHHGSGHDHAAESTHDDPHDHDHAEHDDHDYHHGASGRESGHAGDEDLAEHGEPEHQGAHDAHEGLDDHDDREGHDDHRGHDDHGAHDDHHEHEEGIVSVPPEVLREFGIMLTEAGPGVLQEQVVLPGEIRFNREQLAYGTPRFAGTVTSIKVRLADEVRNGQVLATLESTETLRPFEVEAPFDGTIVAYEITPGETVEAGTPLFTVADLSSVWADLQIYQRDLRKIRRGLRVTVINGHEGPVFNGTISYIAPTINQRTRTGLARVVVDNTSGEWRPGQFVKGHVTTEQHPVAVAVPRSAVLTHEGQTVVFVQTDDGFEPKPIRLGHSDAATHEVKDGLAPGETYVARNAISLKAELSKGAFGGHVH